MRPRAGGCSFHFNIYDLLNNFCAQLKRDGFEYEWDNIRGCAASPPLPPSSLAEEAASEARMCLFFFHLQFHSFSAFPKQFQSIEKFFFYLCYTVTNNL